MWTEYRSTFPARYIEPGHFDEYLTKVIREKKPHSILDVGGGTEGTIALKGLGIHTYLLDPGVKEKPYWMRGRVDWDTPQRFSAIVARGSINYLKKEELFLIKKMLEPGGVFLANTFAAPPSEEWRERPYRTLAGSAGVERSRYNSEKRIIEHELIPDSGAPISHTFFYYSPEEYQDIFPGAEIIPYHQNSAILRFEQA
jgi:hypothetical protein